VSGYTGYINFIQVKPAVTAQPSTTLKRMLAAAPQGRRTTAGCVNAQPLVPVPNTAGRSGSCTGTCEQARIDWSALRAASSALEAVYFGIGAAVRSAGGRDSGHLGAPVVHGW
jgi:hypothetical protein